MRSSGKDTLLNAFKYETVAVLVRQCINNTSASSVQLKSVSLMSVCAFDSRRKICFKKKKLSLTELISKPN